MGLSCRITSAGSEHDCECSLAEIDGHGVIRVDDIDERDRQIAETLKRIFHRRVSQVDSAAPPGNVRLAVEIE